MQEKDYPTQRDISFSTPHPSSISLQQLQDTAVLYVKEVAVAQKKDRSALFSTIFGSLSLLSGRQKFAVSLLAGATLFLNSLDIVAITLLSLVAGLALGQGTAGDLSWFDGIERNTLVIYILLTAAGVFVAKTASGIFLTKVRHTFLAKLEVHFSDIIAAYIFSKDLSTVRRYSRSHLEWTILRSTYLAFGSVVGQSLSLFAEASLMIFILGLFFYTDWVSAVLVLFYFSGVLLIFQLATRRSLALTGSDFARGSVSVGQAISDMIAGYKEMAVHSRIPYFLERISQARAGAARASALNDYVQGIPRLVVELALIFGAIGFTALQFATTDGSPDLAVISIFIVGGLRMMSSLLPLYRAFVQLRYERPQAFASQALVREARTAIPSVLGASATEKGATTTPIEEVSGALEVTLDNVTFQYKDRGERETAIDRITLTIKPGSTVALIGPSGAGKSTLVDLILGLHQPSSGEVLCSGIGPKALRNAFPGLISYVPQKPGLISGTLRDNIALGIPANEVDDKALWEAIRGAQIEEFINGSPEGINSLLGEQSDGLSGGQIQRIGVARALYTRPRLLVLDEATSGLDAETEASITDALYKLGDQTTIIVVAHRLSTIQHADTVFVIDKGTLVASGKLRDLERDVPLVKKYIALMSFD